MVHAIAYSPDGQILASTSQDKTIKLWNVRHEGLDLDSLLATACYWLSGYLRHNPNVSASDKKLLERCSESKFKQS
jgi:WD40 repeat protein